jgi:hypothetical protein
MRIARTSSMGSLRIPHASNRTGTRRNFRLMVAFYAPMLIQWAHVIHLDSMAPWPHQLCPCPGCAQDIRDLLAEMVPNAQQSAAAFRAVTRQSPGGAITCPYCQGAVEYSADGRTLVASTRVPLRYSRAKMEMRAKDYGSQKSPPEPAMTPEEWVAEEKLMPGALSRYVYAEDMTP